MTPVELFTRWEDRARQTGRTSELILSLPDDGNAVIVIWKHSHSFNIDHQISLLRPNYPRMKLKYVSVGNIPDALKGLSLPVFFDNAALYIMIQQMIETHQPKQAPVNNFKIAYTELVALQNIQSKLYGQAKAMGWHNKPREIGTLLCLIHSEISEALEGARKGLQDDHLPHRSALECELADAVIRIFDLAGKENLDLAGAIAEKHSYNAVRADHQLANREATGGKAF